ncbi:TnsA endonuclease N-terminal domain-containing protein [Pseudomonas sp. W03]|uniref:TnsA endonuclease N-terminal domain-containing protein n=1 Tax=Pseudomonas sp. W03 TaxID=3090666 RepID=UPI003A4E6451
MSSTVYKGQLISQTRRARSMTRSLSGVIPFRGQGIYYESGLERDFIRIWMLDSDVVAIVAQPAQIPFTALNGRDYIYPPDFFVHFDERTGRKPLLVEVKMREQWTANWREWLPKWKAAYRYARERGWQFRVYDETRIRGPVLQNVEYLQRYRNLDFDPAFTSKVLNTLALMKAAPFHHLLALHFTGNEAIGRSHLLHLIATEQVHTDLELELDDHSILRMRHEGR